MLGGRQCPAVETLQCAGACPALRLGLGLAWGDGCARHTGHYRCLGGVWRLCQARRTIRPCLWMSQCVIDIGDSGPATRRQIILRSQVIARAGAYVGLFELLVFCAHFKVRLHVFLRPGEWQELPASFLELPDSGTWPPQHLAHCRIEISSENARHLAVPTEGLQGTHYVVLLKNGLDGSTDMPASTRLDDHAMANGFTVFETVADGDCGPDAMLIFLGLPRTPGQRLKMRTELARAMSARADLPDWQRAWALAGERDPLPKPPKASTPFPFKKNCIKFLGVEGMRRLKASRERVSSDAPAVPPNAVVLEAAYWASGKYGSRDETEQWVASFTADQQADLVLSFQESQRKRPDQDALAEPTPQPRLRSKPRSRRPTPLGQAPQKASKPL